MEVKSPLETSPTSPPKTQLECIFETRSYTHLPSGEVITENRPRDGDLLPDGCPRFWTKMIIEVEHPRTKQKIGTADKIVDIPAEDPRAAFDWLFANGKGIAKDMRERAQHQVVQMELEQNTAAARGMIARGKSQELAQLNHRGRRGRR